MNVSGGETLIVVFFLILFVGGFVLCIWALVTRFACPTTR
jgi:hypothetical protein